MVAVKLKQNKKTGAMPSVCLFCGSRSGDHPGHTETAREIGRLIAAENWRLVYGAGDIGLMGEAARSACNAGGAVFGVMPEHLINLEAVKFDLDSLVITETMHERKKIMFMNSDAVVTLPGGIGTLDEFFEVITWKQLGLHDKPIILVNSGNYWEGLTGLIEKAVAEEFADASALQLFSVVGSPSEAVRVLRHRLS